MAVLFVGNASGAELRTPYLAGTVGFEPTLARLTAGRLTVSRHASNLERPQGVAP